ncbi:GNAT family N-acetyltransferase [Streptomyces solincola]|uniref:GNAT family N-acetyltransferase n=1 Tax=Streptomyces solincola TaxID=2100817 RepID=A0A2S9PVQ0_9ACTN|nr:GNAT family N-acetyltransferase [Streptomyces solincola]PRH78506.1 GNAT family N-acetyltransferase [Streptomyces solincola]
MAMIVRDFEARDAAAVVAVRRAALPFEVVTEASLRFTAERANPAERYRLLVAEREGEVVGAANCGLAFESPEPGRAHTTPYVVPGHRRRGVGTALLRAAEEHLTAHGATEVYCWALEGSGGPEFAARHGYRPARSAHFQSLDLTASPLPELPEALPPAVELHTAAAWQGDPRPLFTADAQVTADEPSDVGAELDDYEDWLTRTWRHPLFDRELSTVATVGGEIAAFTAARTDGRTRYFTGMTGTLRGHRGRGLARLVKTDSLRRARAAGYTEAFTSNDGANEPMLAVNRRLGYEVRATEVRHVRAFG